MRDASSTHPQPRLMEERERGTAEPSVELNISMPWITHVQIIFPISPLSSLTLAPFSPLFPLLSPSLVSPSSFLSLSPLLSPSPSSFLLPLPLSLSLSPLLSSFP